MESSELAMLAVGVATAVANGASTGVGEGAGAAVTDLVRSRLARTERGRAALEGIDGGGAGGSARSESRARAQAVLREEIDADPELGRQLALHLNAPTTYNRDAVVIDHSTITRSHISLGPITVKKTPGALTVLALTGVLLLALVALGVYGGTRLIADDGTRDASAQGSGEGGAGKEDEDAPEEGKAADTGGDPGNRTRALTVAQTRAALPVRGDLPPGWTQQGEAGAAAASGPGGCHQGGTKYALSSAGAGYVRAEYYVFGCDSPAQAERVRKQLVQDQSGYDGTTPLSLPTLGDKSSTFTYYKEPEDSTNAMAVLRVGSTVGWLRLGEVDDLPNYEAQLDDLARAFVDRIERTLADG
ncbi:hypothetical protein DEJ48_03820 [Streptomyces venezuelae]|uniref:Uncharacterized protein n=1 Tax=Streptomyces venezuelae TaxID=54571 RepID=A0A5P2BQB3_STRVZ|nr:hypothetical protein [Streptomyces venezuelae]QES32644.1 hypothetical protein DEJ48_03820 [Streptomyces venezuelae]